MTELVRKGETSYNIVKKPKESAFKRKKTLRGKKLAKLYFIDGLSQKNAVKIVFPRYSDKSAEQHSTEIFKRYDVLRHFLDMMPDTWNDTDPERLLTMAMHQAQERGDPNLTLAILDRLAKLKGRYNNELKIVPELPEERLNRLNEAREALKAQGIDPDKLTWE